MTTETLNEMVTKYNELQKTASMDLEDVPAVNRAGWVTRIESAKSEKAALETQYRDKLLSSTLAVFVNGDEKAVDLFVKTAETEGGVLVLDASSMYKRLAVAIDQAMGGARTFTHNYAAILIRGLKEVGNELGLTEIPGLDLGSTPVVKTVSEVVDLVRNLIRKSSGDQLNSKYMAKTLADSALRIRYKNKTVPVVIIGATPSEIAGLTPLFATVGAQVNLTNETENEETIKDTVIKTFKEAKKTLNTNRKVN